MSIQVISSAPYNLEHVLCVLCISQFQLCTTTPLPSRADPPGISIFLALDGKFPAVGTKTDGKCPALHQH